MQTALGLRELDKRTTGNRTQRKHGNNTTGQDDNRITRYNKTIGQDNRSTKWQLGHKIKEQQDKRITNQDCPIGTQKQKQLNGPPNGRKWSTQQSKSSETRAADLAVAVAGIVLVEICSIFSFKTQFALTAKIRSHSLCRARPAVVWRQ